MRGLLVPLTGRRWIDGEVPRLVMRRYVEPLIAAGASVIVLRCTHFPLLKTLIAEAAAEFAGQHLRKGPIFGAKALRKSDLESPRSKVRLCP